MVCYQRSGIQHLTNFSFQSLLRNPSNHQLKGTKYTHKDEKLASSEIYYVLVIKSRSMLPQKI